jgi:hypothetical protein
MMIIREHVSVTGFCRQYMTVSLSQNLHFLQMKLDTIYSEYISDQANRYFSSINLTGFSGFVYDQKIRGKWAITA